jgi:hypothetical protein
VSGSEEDFPGRGPNSTADFPQKARVILDSGDHRAKWQSYPLRTEFLIFSDRLYRREGVCPRREKVALHECRDLALLRHLRICSRSGRPGTVQVFFFAELVPLRERAEL